MRADVDWLVPVFAGSQSIVLEWPGLKVEYAWLPPFEGCSLAQPNRLKVVFSAHSRVAMQLGNRVHDIEAPGGTLYVVGAEPTSLLNVPEYSDTLNIHPDMNVLRAAAHMAGISKYELQPTLQSRTSVKLQREPGVLGAAHLIRRACIGRQVLSDIGASTLTYHLARRMLLMQYGIEVPELACRNARLDELALRRVCDYIEEHLSNRITLEVLAELARLSPFHFCRCFKASTGLAPHQYVTARRIELAKRLVVTSTCSVQEIAWSIGFENISHFRRQFAAQVGAVPGAVRRAVKQGASRPLAMGKSAKLADSRREAMTRAAAPRHDD